MKTLQPLSSAILKDQVSFWSKAVFLKTSSMQHMVHRMISDGTRRQLRILLQHTVKLRILLQHTVRKVCPVFHSLPSPLIYFTLMVDCV